MDVSNFFPSLTLLAALSPAVSFAQFDDFAFDDTDFDSDLPVVLTAVRLKQLQSDVPASVSVLHGQTLLDLGIKDLSEAFRLVPGMMVGFDANNQVSVVHYHGGPASLPRNLQVLLDGRSVYYSAVASVDWKNIPIAIEDIDRIEVVRGPNASSYGSNAYQAIINILSKHPADSRGAEVSQRTGNNGVNETYVNYSSGIANTNYRFSLVQKNDAGYTHEDADHENDYSSVFIDNQVQHRLFDGSELKVAAIYLKSDKPLVRIPGASQLVFEEKDQEVTRQELSAQWEKSISPKHKIKVSSFASYSNHISTSNIGGGGLYNLLVDPNIAELYQSNPEALNAIFANKLGEIDFSRLSARDQELMAAIGNRYDAENLDTFSGVIDNTIEETRVDVEIQDTLILNPNFTLVSGAGFRRDIAESETFFSGYASNNTGRIFSSLDWDSLANWKAHIGLMWEKESDLEAVFNPRGALIYRLGHNQSLRAVVAKSVRSPDLFETQTSWHYTLTDIQSEGPIYGDTFYQTLDINDDLRHEKILSKEIGYYGLTRDGKFELDVRIFHEELTDVLEQNLRLDRWENQNSAEIFFRGAEYQTAYRPIETTQLRMTYAYIDAGSSGSESTLLRVYAQNSGSLSWVQKWPLGISSSMAYYLADSYNQMDDPEEVALYERLDARLAKSFALDHQYDLDTSVAFQKDLSGDGLVFDDVKYKDSVRYVFNMGVKF